VELRFAPGRLRQLQAERFEGAVRHLVTPAVLIDERAQPAHAAPTGSVSIKHARNPRCVGRVLPECRVEGGSKLPVIENRREVNQRPREIRQPQEAPVADVAGADVSRPPYFRAADLRFARGVNGDVHRFISGNVEAEPPRRTFVREHCSFAGSHQGSHFALVESGLITAEPKDSSMHPFPLAGRQATAEPFPRHFGDGQVLPVHDAELF